MKKSHCSSYSMKCIIFFVDLTSEKVNMPDPGEEGGIW